jgi:PAS domain S-box-containing protein
MHDLTFTTSETGQANACIHVDALSDAGIFTLDAAGQVLTWNACAERLTGYTSAEIIARHFSRLYFKDVQHGRSDDALRIAARTGWYESGGLGLRKDGSRFRASVVITAMVDAAGQPAGFSIIIRDVSGRQHPATSPVTQVRPVEDVQAHAVQWRAIFANGPVGMVKVGLDGRYLEVNPKFCELLGYSADELKQLNYRDLGPAEDIVAAEVYLRQLLAGEIESYTREKIFIRKDGTRI